MRTLSAPALAALQRNPLPIALLIEMDLTVQLYLNTGGIDLTIGGIVYSGTQGLGRVDAVQESPAEIKPLRFELGGVPSTMIALALAEPVQGKAVRVKTALFDPDTYQIIETRLRWQGQLDVMAIEDGIPTATVQVSAEHAAIDLLRTATSYYSDSEQRRLFSGDPSMQYVADQAEVKIVWPAASWGRK
jgi:hypothetical protein